MRKHWWAGEGAWRNRHLGFRLLMIPEDSIPTRKEVGSELKTSPDYVGGQEGGHITCLEEVLSLLR